MATIAKLVIAAEVDTGGIQEGLDRAATITANFAQTTNTILKTAFANQSAAADGAKIAQSLLDGLTGVFERESTQSRVALFRGLIDPAEFKAQGAIAARGLNDGLIAGMQQLAQRGLLTDELARSITDQFKKEGLAAGGAFNSQLGAGLRSGSSAVEGFSTTAGGHLLEFGKKGVIATEQVARGFEQIVKGGSAAETGTRGLLKVVGDFAGVFGPAGFFVAAVASAGNAVLNILNATRDKALATQKTFRDELARLTDVGGIEGQLGMEKQLAKLQGGTASKGFQDGLNAMKAQRDVLRALLASHPETPDVSSGFAAGKIGGGGRTPLEQIVADQRSKLKALEPVVAQLEKDQATLMERINHPLRAPNDPVGLSSSQTFNLAGDLTSGLKAAKTATKTFLDDIQSLVDASKQAVAENTTFNGLSARIVSAYDQVTFAIARQKDQFGDYADKLRKVRDELGKTPIGQILSGQRTPSVSLTPTGDVPPPLTFVNPPRVAQVDPTKLTIREPSLRNTATDALHSQSLSIKNEFHSLVGGIAQQFSPLGLAMTVFGGLMEGLQPVIDAVKEPLRLVGEILGKALAPILRALFPVFKAIAIAATYVGEIFCKVSAFILRAVGSLVRGLGNLINKLPGSPGDPLVRAGQAMLNLADGFTEGANELAKGRDELRQLQFGGTADALNKTTAAANSLTDSLLNVPSGFRIAQAIYNATKPIAGPPSIPSQPISFDPKIPFTPTPSAPDSPTSPRGGGGGGAAPITININGANKDPKQIAKEVLAKFQELAYTQMGDSSRWAELT